MVAEKINYILQIELETDSQPIYNGVDRLEYLKKLANNYWGDSWDNTFASFKKINAYSNQGLADREFAKQYINLLNNIKKIEKIVVEFGSPDTNRTMSARMAYSLYHFVSVLIETYGESIQILIVLPKNIPKSNIFGQQLLELLKENSHSSLYLVQEHKFLVNPIKMKKDIELVLNLLESDNIDLRTSRYEMLGQNVVCHLGKFTLKEGKNEIIYDYYDGSRASSQIYECLREEFKVMLYESSKTKIKVVYDGGVFNWFEEALESIVSHFDGRVSVFDAQNIEPSSICNPDVILCPVIRSGETLQSIIELTSNDESSFEPILICLVYASGSNKNIVENIEIILNNGLQKSLDIRAYIQRGVRGVFLKELWKDANFKAIPSNTIEDYNSEFSSASMWAMLFESKLVHEKNKRTRTLAENFPDFADLFIRNKPLYIQKIKSIENALRLGNAKTYLIPDESVPKLITQELCKGSDQSYALRIHPSLIEIACNFGNNEWDDFEKCVISKYQFTEVMTNFADVKAKITKLFNEGGSATSKPQYLIIDTCLVTGNTLNGLKSIAYLLGGDVAGSITLARFQDSVSISNFKQNDYSFYSFGKYK